jgi:hypothetical protein
LKWVKGKKDVEFEYLKWQNGLIRRQIPQMGSNERVTGQTLVIDLLLLHRDCG